jgi:23S rRNA U2552 (ribose-2'-O)-methylase RlmE/FtsJ
MNYNLASENTDKFIGGILKSNIGHNYQLLYKNFLIKKPNRILEIGTAHGGFAKFLRDNCIVNTLIGADIAPNDFHNHVSNHTNYNNLYDDFYIGDAFTQNFIDWLKEKNYIFDFVIEDADHSPQTQAFMLKNCNHFLSDNGVYIVEDVRSYEIAKDLIDFIPEEYRFYSYIWDASVATKRNDDICIVIDLRK